MRVRWELGSDTEYCVDELALRYRIALSDPTDLPFADCMHRLIPFDRSAGTLDRSEAKTRRDPLLDEPMVPCCSGLAAPFRDLHLPCLLWPICPSHQLLSELIEKSLHAFGFHCRKRHPVNSRCSVVGLGLPIGFPESLPFANVYIQAPEPVWSKYSCGATVVPE
jgi:hypothetical protein